MIEDNCTVLHTLEITDSERDDRDMDPDHSK